LLYLDDARVIYVLADGLHSNETMVFARGPYGQGILISEPLDQTITRLRPDGSLSLFAEAGTEPFGPAGLSYGPDPQDDLAEALYAVDDSGGTIQRLSPDGSASRFGGADLGAEVRVASGSCPIRSEASAVGSCCPFSTRPKTVPPQDLYSPALLMLRRSARWPTA